MNNRYKNIRNAFIFAFSIVLFIQSVNSFSCTNNSGVITCRIPISSEIQSGVQEIKIENTEIMCNLGNCEITFSINNPTEEYYEKKYYAYAYIGSVCKSCVNSRDENLQKIKLDPFSSEEIKLPLEITETGKMSFKLLYKKPNLRTWKEIRGEIVVLEEQTSQLPIAVLSSTNNIEEQKDNSIKFENVANKKSRYGIWIGLALILGIGANFVIKIMKNKGIKFPITKSQKLPHPNQD